MTDFNEINSESKNKNVIKLTNDSVPFLFSSRFVISIMAFFGCVIAYILRLNLGFAMVCMVQHKINSSRQDECLHYLSNQSSVDSEITTAEFDWDKSLQGTLLAAFFYGYIVTQVPAGWLCRKFGPKIVLIVGQGVASILSLAIPESARLSPYFLLAIRVLQGMFAASSFPATHSLIGSWAPTNERGLILSLAYSGIYVGTMITFPMSGLLCNYGFAGGWPSIFYVTGIVGVVWIIGVIFFVFDNYEKHPRISEKEKLFLQNAGLENHEEHEKTKIPWIRVLKSGPVWAIAIAHLTANWGLYTLVINLPTYMDDVHKFKIKENGFLSALPYLCTLIITLISGKLSDFIIRKKTCSTTVVRKTFNSVGMFIPCLCMFLLTLLNCEHRFYAVAVVVILQSFTGFAYTGGFFLNHVDIAPNFAGILMGISNMCGQVPGILSPILVGFVTTDGTLAEWSIVFYVGVGAYALGGLLYLLLASGEEQDWEFNSNETQLEMEDIQPKEVERLTVSVGN